MNTDELFAKQIKGYLDQSLVLPQANLARLKAARERALHNQRLVEPALAWAWPSKILGLSGPRPMVGRILVPVAIAVLGLVGYQHWLQIQAEQEGARQAAEMAEVDAALLKHELPIDAFLDVGFRTWLKPPAE
jgi:Protein of unknown function (DUF3619)